MKRKELENWRPNLIADENGEPYPEETAMYPIELCVKRLLVENDRAEANS